MLQVTDHKLGLPDSSKQLSDRIVAYSSRAQMAGRHLRPREGCRVIRPESLGGIESQSELAFMNEDGRKTKRSRQRP
jgi:hypothetical protein